MSISISSLVQAAWSKIVAIKYSFIAFLVVIFLTFLTMGGLGLGLYYLIFFALPISYPDINEITGDWVWPAIIMISMAWSLGFLFAGRFNQFLESRNASTRWRRLSYFLVLWIWAYLLWFMVLFNR